MKGYSTKYCLTTGIAEVEVDTESVFGSPEMCALPGYENVPKYVYTGQGMRRQQFVTGKNFFRTRQEAAEATVKAAKAKIKAAHKQIAKLERQIEVESLVAVAALTDGVP